MDLTLPLAQFDDDTHRLIDRGAVYAATVPGMGRIELRLTISAYNSLGRRPELPLTIRDDEP